VLSVVIPARDPISVAQAALENYPFADEVVVQGGPGGVANAKNWGARKAHGDLLLFTDDDTTVELLGPLEDHGEALWVAREILTDCEDQHTVMACAAMTALVSFGRGPLWTAAIGPFTLVKRAWFDHVGGFQKDPQEDTQFGRRVVKAGGRVGVAPVRVTVHRAFSARNFGLAIDAYVRDSALPELDGPAVVLDLASARLK
jgi:hypothetical protein